MARQSIQVEAARFYFNLTDGNETLAIEQFTKDFRTFNNRVDPSTLVKELCSIFETEEKVSKDGKVRLTADYLVVKLWQARGSNPLEFTAIKKEVSEFLAECREKIAYKVGKEEKERPGRFAGQFFESKKGQGNGWAMIPPKPNPELEP